MFGRVTAESIRRGYSTVRDHLYRGYGQARIYASHLDSAVSIAARTYRALQPVLKDVAPDLERRTTSMASSAKNEYHELRRKALQINDNMTAVEAQLKRKVPELGL